MDMNDIMNFISTCGFPVACCAYLMYQNSQQEKSRERETEQLRKTVDANTRAVKELTEYIKGA